MERNKVIDNLRGIAFLLMVFQHIFYFYDMSGDYKTKYALNPIVDTAGTISRVSFILLAGYMISYKNTTIIKRAKRSGEILLHALLITMISYLLYPKYFIQFGILHFLGIGTFLISFLTPYKFLSIIVLIISLFIQIPKIHPIIDTMTGTYSFFNTMDYFPLKTWMPLLLSGLILGQNTDLSIFKMLDFNNFITDIGKNSLNLYTLHVIILLIFYKLLNKIMK